MLKSKKWALLAGLMLVSLVVAACQPQEVQVPVTVVVKETQVQTVVETKVVQVESTTIVEVEAGAFTQPQIAAKVVNSNI